MKLIVFDTETTTFQKGNPFSRRNKLVQAGYKLLIEDTSSTIITTSEDFKAGEVLLNTADLIVGFNLKFDLHWAQRYGFFDPYSFTGRVWDCQLVHFLMSNQQTPYPSLDGVAAYHGLGSKLHTIKEKYWDQGIDTDAIPTEELTEYLIQDLELTHQVYLKQVECMSLNTQSSTKCKPINIQKLASLMNQDLLVLQQMEYNGLKYNSKASDKENTKVIEEVQALETKLKGLLNAQHPINFNSHEELSAMLYGGTILCERSVQVGFFKTGTRKGEPKFKKVEYPIVYPRLIEPAERSELAKPGYWSTDAITFQKLKLNRNTRPIIEALLQRAELESLSSKYLGKMSKRIIDMDWQPDMVHGQFNQSVAVTGRLSSKEPNLQNFSSRAKQFIESRYD